MNRRACAGRGDFGWLLSMAEGRRSPLEGLLPWALPGGEVALAELRFAEQIGVRVRPPVAAYLAGVPLSLQPNRVASMRLVRTLWLGPDEWLVTAPEGAAPDLRGRITRALTSRQATVTDLSASRAVIEISGPRALARRMADRRRSGICCRGVSGESSPHPNPPPQAREGAIGAAPTIPPSLAGEGGARARGVGGWGLIAVARIGKLAYRFVALRSATLRCLFLDCR